VKLPSGDHFISSWTAKFEIPTFRGSVQDWLTPFWLETSEVIFAIYSSYSQPDAILVSSATRAHTHQWLVGIWTTAKCIAMLFALQLMRMCALRPIETKLAAG
jgi:hypothetical protein